MPEIFTIAAESADAGLRLDKFLATPASGPVARKAPDIDR